MDRSYHANCRTRTKKINERIRELNYQALCDVMNGPDPDRDIEQMYIPAEFTKKFAELIVRECADLVDNNDDSYPYLSFGDMIKEHFGVES